MMEKKKRRSLHNIMAMAFTFAMIMVFAGLVGKMEVNAGTCKVTVQVTDTQGTPIPNAEVIFTDYYSPYEELATVTKNDDGTYNVPFDDEEWWYNYYRYYATADDYKPSASKVGEYLIGAELDLSNNNAVMTLPDIKLTYYPPFEQVQDDINAKRDAIDNYLNENDYDPVEWAEIENIIAKYKKQIKDIEDELTEDETKESAEEKKANLAEILENAIAELDAVYTAQEIVNEDNADDISFIPADGSEAKSLTRKQYGKFGITLSYFEKGGKFQVTDKNGQVINDVDVTWNAKGRVEGINYNQYIEDFEFIDDKYDTSVFLYSNWLNGAKPGIITADIPNCSVTYTKEEKEITVTFDLKVIARNININVLAPTEVELTRNKDTLAYNVEVTPGDGESQYLAEVQSDDPGYVYDGDITITSLDEKIATVDKNNTITPLKAGTVTFVASAEGCEDVEFEIEFVKSDEEKREDSALEGFDKLIAAIGNVTLDKETAVQNARDAYDKLSENAKKRLDPETLKVLTKAEATITALKTEAINKAEELKKAQEAANAAANTTTTPTVQLSKIALKAKAGKGKVKLTWKKSSKADGYIIYRATKKNGKYKQIKVIKSWKKNSFTDKKVKSKKTYYYKICPYKGTVNGPVSAAKKAKVK